VFVSHGLHSFDLIATIAFPIAVLLYSYMNFNIDRHAIQINMANIPPGFFERNARMIADPAEIALFLAGFDSLRILTYTDFFLRVSMNLSFCNRLQGVVNAMLLERRRRVQVHVDGYGSTSSPDLQMAQAQRPVPRYLASIFVVFAAVVLAFSDRAVASSYEACKPYPQCAVYAHRWSDSTTCPCLTLIDVERSPRTFDEWMHPVDVTDVVHQLSASGDLRALQLINRGLPHWPDELRKCRRLQYV
jgi:hypothetical protein